jgi:hypothetical protein
MLIVGGGAALLAIAAWFVWLAVKSLRASRQARRRESLDARAPERHHDMRNQYHPAPGE